MIYEIDILPYDADMNKVREALADLLIAGEQKENKNSVIVDSHDVGEAVRRINALGYETDEDE